MKIQATKRISSVRLNEGVTIDCDTSKKRLIGFSLVTANNVALDNISIGLKVDTDEIFEILTPATLFHSSDSVTPNERFYSLFEPRVITGKKFFVKTSGLAFPDVIIMFLLD